MGLFIIQFLVGIFSFLLLLCCESSTPGWGCSPWDSSSYSSSSGSSASCYSCAASHPLLAGAAHHGTLHHTVPRRDLQLPATPVLRVIHSWLGLLTMGLFIIQFLVGIFSFLLLLCCE